MGKRGRPPHPDILTPREWEVLALLRQRLTNREIAERLGVTVYAARYHVSQIISKLGVTTREGAAAWRAVPAPGPEPRRRWWAPVVAWLRPLTLAKAAGIAASVTTVVGLVVLAWGVLRTSGEDDRTVNAAASPSSTLSVTAPPEPVSLGAPLQRGLWTFPVDGGAPSRFLPVEGLTGGRFDDAYELSPDGGWYAVAQRTAVGSNIFVGAIDGSASKEIALDFSAYLRALSPLGKTLLLEGQHQEGTRMYLLDATTGGSTDVGPQWYTGVQAAWSPDGQHLLLVGAPEEHSTSGVYVADFNAGAPHLVLEGAHWEAAWAPDSSVFATTTGQQFGDRQLVVAAIDGTVTRSFPHTNPGAIDPQIQWSPDGKRLAYLEFTPGHFALRRDPTNAAEAGREIHVIELETGEKRVIAAGVDASWSPQGNHLAFISGGELNVVSAAGGEPRRLTTHERPSLYSTHWADASTILAAYAPRVGESIYAVNLESGARSRFLDGYSPTWSPDGKQIAFIGDSTGVGFVGTEVIYVANHDGTGMRPIGAYDWSDMGGCSTQLRFSWSPDGRYLASSHGTIEGETLHAVNPGDSPPQVKTGCAASWSPREMKLAFGGSSASGYTFEVFDARAGASAWRTVHQHPIDNSSWSRDGAVIAFIRQSELVVVNEDGSGERIVAKRACSGYSQAPRWSPDDSSLLVVDCAPAGPPGEIVEPNPPIISVIDLASGQARAIARGNQAEWSPDGRTVAYSDWGSGSTGRAVYLVSAARGEPRKLTSGYAPVWSLDGNTILVTSDVLP